MKEKFAQKMEWVASLFKYCYIVHILFAFNTLLVDKSILNITPVIVLALGAIVVIYRILCAPRFIKYPFFILYIAFLVFFVISALTNFEYGWIGNAKITIWMTLQFVGLYLFDLQRKYSNVVKEFKICLYFLIAIVTVMNVISVGMLFANYCGFCIMDDGKSFLIGVAYWGRLYGIHTDPNYGSTISVVAGLAAIWLFLQTKKKYLKCIMVITVAFQAMFVAFSASRTGMVALGVSVIVFAFIYAFRKSKKVFKAVIVALIAVVLALGVNKGITVGYNMYTTVIAELNSKPAEEGKDDSEEQLVEIGREGELNGDVSNRRFDLWKNAIQISKTRPLAGISFGNIVAYAKANVPDSYLLTNGYMVFNAFHNMFFDLLVSQGILGFATFIVIMLGSLVYLLRNCKKIQMEQQVACIFLFSACSGMITSSLFVSEILYVNNQVTVIFWTLWGFLMYFCCYGKKNEGEAS